MLLSSWGGARGLFCACIDKGDLILTVRERENQPQTELQSGHFNPIEVPEI